MNAAKRQLSKQIGIALWVNARRGAVGGMYRQAGVTLVELVLVIVVTGILAAVVAIFIRSPVKGYAQSAARAELSDAADLALRRIARDIRLALPNSVRIAGDESSAVFLELIPTKAGGRYLDENDPEIDVNVMPAPNALNFVNPASRTFDVVGAMPAIVPNQDHIVVYNLDALGADSPNAYYADRNRALVTGVSGNTVTLASNPFASSGLTGSPTRRFHVVTQPVTYACFPHDQGGGQIVRLSGYGFQPKQIATLAEFTALGANSAVLVTNVAQCAFTSRTLPTVNGALIALNLSLLHPALAGEVVTLSHQIHVNNTP